jgi:predicted alpha/beta hydrolase
MRGFSGTVEDWGRLDFGGVLEWVSIQYPGVPRAVVGHSVGGFLTGFASNATLIDRMLLVGAHTGYWGDYAPRARPWMFLLWHLLMPMLTRVVGYFPGRRLHLLEDMPAGAALQWANRRRPDFWWDLVTAEGAPDLVRIDAALAGFRSVHASTLALQFTDDPFATDAATVRILSLFENCNVSRRLLSPLDASVDRIGHFGFFHARFRETLWPLAMDWLAQSRESFDRMEAA